MTSINLILRHTFSARGAPTSLADTFHFYMNLSTRYTEKELVILLKSNDKSAFEYLYDHYAPALYHVTTKILRDEHKAQDILQDAFLKIWGNIQKYEPGKGTLFTWMLNITRNAAIDMLRSELKRQGHLRLDFIEDTELGPAAAFNPAINEMDPRFFVNGLAPQSRLLIEMVYFQGYKHEETAEHLRLPLGTVKSRIRQALKDLRKIYSS